ncbi:hypothetical protein KY289_012846 [Solanum tuberosum]|nr:hypothetical protein KY289_012846 [Solanum tuberosum]
MADNIAYQLDPGPLESSVLTEQITHRSRDIWDGSVNMILNTSRCDGKFWDLVKKYPIPPRVLEVIQLSGLYGVYRSHRPMIDRSLITSLVERWRPETHTFHFRTGEATITLQDVEVLYGLPVNGHPVLGNELIRTIGDWQNICQRLLGFTPCPQDFNHNSLKVSALNAHMLRQPQLTDMATQDIVNQKARCYMFWMIAGMMMANTSGSFLKLMYLPMLEDVNAIGSYSWGSATLACLYRFLCKSSQSNQNEIAGFLPLLQIWAWERVTVLRPQFIWEPYSDELIESLPDYCRIGRDIWRVRAPIFCWDVVEVHLPDRVMRQFGLKQMIPTPFLFDSTHFHHDRRGRPNTNWELEHAQWLPFWNQRLQYICEAPINREPLRYGDPYLIWFRRITRLVIGNPTLCPQQQQGYVPNSTAYETMVRYIHSMVDKAKSLGDQPSMEDFYMRGKGGVAGRRARAAERGQVPVEMDEAVLEPHTGDIGSTSRSHTQEFTPGMTYQPKNSEIVPYMTPQISRDPSLSSLENVFGNYRPQHFENVPNFTSSPVPMSMEILDAMTNLEDSNIEIEGNELDDSNNEVDGNDPENASGGSEPSVKKKRTIFPKFCGTGSHQLNQHVIKKTTKGPCYSTQGYGIRALTLSRDVFGTSLTFPEELLLLLQPIYVSQVDFLITMPFQINMQGEYTHCTGSRYTYVSATYRRWLIIRQYQHLEDGSVNVVTRGQQRFHLRRRWMDVEGSPCGEIQIVKEDLALRTPREAVERLTPLSIFRSNVHSQIPPINRSRADQYGFGKINTIKKKITALFGSYKVVVGRIL